MREQLIQYVQLLFAGAADCDDTRQEILQNTLDRYDDLVAAGKTPEAAYRLAIMGIGDINEILGRAPGAAPLPVPAVKQEEHDTPTKKLLRAIAIGLYILCPIPLFVLSGMWNMGIPGLWPSPRCSSFWALRRKPKMQTSSRVLPSRRLPRASTV